MRALLSLSLLLLPCAASAEDALNAADKSDKEAYTVLKSSPAVRDAGLPAPPDEKTRGKKPRPPVVKPDLPDGAGLGTLKTVATGGGAQSAENLARAADGFLTGRKAALAAMPVSAAKWTGAGGADKPFKPIQTFQEPDAPPVPPAAARPLQKTTLEDKLRDGFKRAVEALPDRGTPGRLLGMMRAIVVAAVDKTEDAALRYVISHETPLKWLKKIAGTEKATLYRGVSRAEAEHIRENGGRYGTDDPRNLYKFVTPDLKTARAYAKKQDGVVLEVDSEEAIRYFKVSDFWNTSEYSKVSREYLVAVTGEEKVRVLD